ncbi:solute carrier family 23 protein [Halomonas daqiaonensis]|uniref:Xanthine/uracil permease n=1 Tax=Halomonas daqiaonensis TaxID=650850 RepID=A0A1H7L4Z3_9GAMM|nr:solute carrier family 23 protein [Halomonas daqiaonensis]SEK94038.1 Xanthine/uracil permease [Halomonas daqiaonensis]
MTPKGLAEPALVDGSSDDGTILRRLLGQPALRELTATPPFDSAVITDPGGQGLLGDPRYRTGLPQPIRAGGILIGQVEGERADELAAFLAACAELNEENRALASESLAKYRELSMLYQVTDRLLAAPDDGEVMALLVEEAKRFLLCDSACVFLLNEETGSLERFRCSGIPFHSRATLEVGDDPLGTVLQTGVGEIVNDVQADPRPVLADGGLRSIICSPIKSRNRLIGVVVVGSESPRHFNAADLQLLNNLAAQGGIAIEVARLYVALRRDSSTPADLIYGLEDRPPAVALLVLGAQHVLIAFMYLAVPVLIGLEGGLAPREIASLVSMSLIAMGLTTLLQFRQLGPVGCGYLAPGITSVIYLPPLLLAVNLGGISLVFGMTLMIGLFGLVFAQVLGRLRRLFPPEVCGVVVLMTGLSIIRVALPMLLGLGDEGMVDPDTLMVGLVTLASMVILTISRFGRVRLYANLLGLLAGYASSLWLGVVDHSLLDQLVAQPWFGLPAVPSLEFSFSPLLVVPFVIASLAANIKVLGLVTSAQKTNDVLWKRPDMRSIRGGIAADSVGNLASGVLGGVGISMSAGNIGLTAATGATSRHIAMVVGSMFIALAFVPKLSAAITLMPAPVMGAGLLYIACFLVISGLEMIVSRLFDSRRTFVVGLALIAGLGLELVPGAAAQAPPWAAAFLTSPLAFATTLAVCLHLLMGFGVSRRAQACWKGRVAGDEIFRFMERQGAAWGARPDVIHRASPALVELCEEVWSQGAEVELAVTLIYDELHLTMEVRWHSGPQEARVRLERLIGHLQRRYDGQARFQAGSDGWLVRFVFEN